MPEFFGSRVTPKFKHYSPQSLGDKIDYEGGIAEFFLAYDGDWEGTELEKEVRDFQKAFNKLDEKLLKLGVEV